MREVASADFVDRFAHFQEVAQTEPLEVVSNGRVAGYFLSPEVYERLRRKAGEPEVLLIEELTEKEIEQIASTRMDPKYDYLNALLDDQ